MSNLVEQFEENFDKITKGVDIASELLQQVNNIEGVVAEIIQTDNDNPGENTIPKERIKDLHSKASDLEGKLKYIFASIVKVIAFIFSFFDKDKDESKEVDISNSEITV